MKTNELIGKALDYAVAKILNSDAISYSRLQTFGRPTEGSCNYPDQDSYWPYEPSESWVQGGPIIASMIEDDDYIIQKAALDKGVKVMRYKDSNIECQFGQTVLIAAMRCLVASELGDEVEIPEYLK